MNFYVRIEGRRLYKEVELGEFVRVWTEAYSLYDASETEYREAIGWERTELAPLSQENLARIWTWKSGGQWGKDQITRSKERLQAFNEFREADKPDRRAFWKDTASQVSRSGFIYQSFAFHIAKPQDFPIVDRNVLRAYTCIRGSPRMVVIDPPEAKTNCWSPEAWDKRYKPYQDFWHGLMEKLSDFSYDNVYHCRILDTAMREFGKQLGKDYHPPNEFKLDVQ